MAKLRGKLWQADIRAPDGKRLRPTFQTEAQARAWEREAKLAFELGKPMPEAQAVAKAQKDRDLTTLGTLFRHVCRTEWNIARASRTLVKNGQDVVDYFGANKVIAEITAAAAGEMRIAFAERGLAPATVNRKTAALSKLLKVAKENNIVDAVPHLKWNQVQKTRFRYLDDREEHAMLTYWLAMNDIDNHDLSILLLDTGARCYTEMMPVAWEHFGPSFSTVTFWTTKTNKPRTVPLTSRCKEILERRKADSSKPKGPFQNIYKNGMRGAWDRMRGALQYEDVTPHVMRHTCCTRLVLGGVDVKRVMEWMGHSAIVTTMRYMQIKPNALEEIVHVLEKRA